MNSRHDESAGQRSMPPNEPYPRNLIRETSRCEPEDPPNLHRQNTRQAIQERGVVEFHDRLAVGGVCSISAKPSKR